jgi:hypothetical protein
MAAEYASQQAKNWIEADRLMLPLARDNDRQRMPSGSAPLEPHRQKGYKTTQKMGLQT